ncbi:sensor histidine kinase KdpD [Chroococcidiopsis sp. TS-821]|uniref:sensor histidine kinase n=1 Tax=Chroococcidiopsis sp. TS-821 TaxID=1378066 RepID=UPI000CEDBD36|nr:HAMP domain-containing sensor histidine kinase [Chroococcidiopsis sp. TS-821]PPS39173.1 ATPase [Chroococcidiopsis sp. TS-821]
MIDESTILDLFAALNVVVLTRLDNKAFKLIGNPPAWFLQFYPEVVQTENLVLEDKFIFLENFLFDAEKHWQEQNKGTLKSGLWIETDDSGSEHYLEAVAVNALSQKFLLISLGELTVNEEKQLLIQQAREKSLNYQALIKETQKKEFLIHCIIHDLAGPLTGIRYCLDLIELQDITDKAKEYLELGKIQAQRQEFLIQNILDTFAAEVESIQFASDSHFPDALECTTKMISLLSPLFVFGKKRLELDSRIDPQQDWRVIGDKARLERVLSNLIENAWRHTPPNTAVTVNIQSQPESILFTVDDQGPGVAPELATRLFQKFTQGKQNTGRSGLGLYFCRITVERWGGKIGYLARVEGGSRFWFSLPKVLASRK